MTVLNTVHSQKQAPAGSYKSCRRLFAHRIPFARPVRACIRID